MRASRAAITRRWPSAPAAGNGTWRCRWVRWAIASITRWPRASSRRSSASCSTARPCRHTPRHGRPCSSSWKGGTTRGAATPRWATCRRSSSNVCMRQAPWTPFRRHESVGARIAGADSRRHRRSSGNTRRERWPTDARLAFGFASRIAAARPAGSSRKRTRACWAAELLSAPLVAETVAALPDCAAYSHGALWKCPGCGRPVGVVLNLKVGQAGAHSPLEISRATAADHACAGAARFPHFHSASSSIPTRKPRSPSTCHDVNPKALTAEAAPTR